MDGPLSQVLKLGFPAEMTIAVAVGVGFGFVLERAGFGRSDNLASIFYGRDFRVLRVMFTAIVTGMLGLYFLDLAGALPLSSIGILDTYVWAQLVGGVLVGAGFIVGGWCPGTSIVGAVSGKLDAMLFVAGLLGGSIAFTLGADAMAPLQNAGAHGRLLLHDAFHVPSGVMVFAVALFALAAFWAAGRVEARVRARARGAAAGEPASNEPEAPARAAAEWRA